MADIYCPRCRQLVPSDEWRLQANAGGSLYWQHVGAHRRESTPALIVFCGYRLPLNRPDLVEVPL